MVGNHLFHMATGRKSVKILPGQLITGAQQGCGGAAGPGLMGGLEQQQTSSITTKTDRILSFSSGITGREGRKFTALSLPLPASF